MHGVITRQMALDLLAVGLTRRDVCRILGVGYNSTYRWEQRLEPLANGSEIHCFRCEDEPVPDPTAYLYLLGQYLGDGHIRKSGRSNCLSIACCTHYPDIIREVEDAIPRVLEKRINGAVKRYTYPRYQFSNESEDIKRIFTDALDLLDIPWRVMSRKAISIARREAVAALDEFVGPKS